MRIAVTGSSGLIGSALVPRLIAAGHTVVRVVRSAPTGADQAGWDPATGRIDAGALAGVDAAVHLAGEGIGTKRWSAAQKQRILDSRVRGTRLLAETLASLEPRPATFVSGSAVGYYGLRGDEVLTERSTSGSGFLADVTRQWESATRPAEDAGIRTVHLRTGIVLAQGGALGRLLPLVKLGLGGRLGPGTQWWSWISLPDEVRLIEHALGDDAVAGPLNATAPEPATNAEIVKTLGRILRRPTVLPAPKLAMALVMGKELTDEVILAGQRALPTVAEASGFTFVHRDHESALRALLDR